MIEIVGVLLAGISIVGLGISVVRISLDGRWHIRYRHRCGYHDMLLGRIRKRVCPKCGAATSPKDYDLVTARATWPIGWEEKP